MGPVRRHPTRLDSYFPDLATTVRSREPLTPAEALHLLDQARSDVDPATLSYRTLVQFVSAAAFNASDLRHPEGLPSVSPLGQALSRVLREDDDDDDARPGGGKKRRAFAEHFYRATAAVWSARQQLIACDHEYGMGGAAEQLARLRVASLRPAQQPQQQPPPDHWVAERLDTVRRLHVCNATRYCRWIAKHALRTVLGHCRRLDCISLAWSDALIVPFVHDLVTMTDGRLTLRHLQVKCLGLPFNGGISWNITKRLSVARLSVHTSRVYRVNVDFLLGLVEPSALTMLVIVAVPKERQMNDLATGPPAAVRFLDLPSDPGRRPNVQPQPTPPPPPELLALRYVHAVCLYHIWSSFNPCGQLHRTLERLPRLELLYAHAFPVDLVDPPSFDQMLWALDGCSTTHEACAAIRVIFDAYGFPRGRIGYWRRGYRQCRFAFWYPVPLAARFSSRPIVAIVAYPRLDLLFMVTCAKATDGIFHFPEQDDLAASLRKRPRPPTYRPLRVPGGFDLEQAIAADHERRSSSGGGGGDPAESSMGHIARKALVADVRAEQADRGMAAQKQAKKAAGGTGVGVGAALADVTTNAAAAAAVGTNNNDEPGPLRRARKRKASLRPVADPDSEDADDCPICMLPLGDLAAAGPNNHAWGYCACGGCIRPRTLPCAHRFHPACLTTWLNSNPRNQSCPLCRRRAIMSPKLIPINRFQAHPL